MENIAFLHAFRLAKASENIIFDCSVPFLAVRGGIFCLPNAKLSRENCQ